MNFPDNYVNDQSVIVVYKNNEICWLAFQWNNHYYVLIKEETSAFFSSWFRVTSNVWRWAWKRHESIDVYKMQYSTIHYNSIVDMKIQLINSTRVHHVPEIITRESNNNLPIRILYNGKVKKQ